MTVLAEHLSPLEVLNPSLRSLVPRAIASCKKAGIDLAAGEEILPGCFLTEAGLTTDEGQPYGYDDVTIDEVTQLIINLSHLSR